MTLDTQLFFALNLLAGQSRLADSSIVFFAAYLPYLIVVALLVLVFFSDKSKREKWEMLVVTGIAGLLARFGAVEIIRFFYHRPRPFLTLHAHQLLSESSWSFPSGHATFFFALAMAVYLYNKKWGIGFFVAATIVAVSRVIAGVHYPSDILGGALLGVAIAYGTHYLAHRFFIVKVVQKS